MLFDNLKILYAEDEEVLRETMRSIIAKEVKAFYVARDGEEAYKLYKELKPDILLIDVNMPFMSGIDVVRKIREIDPVIRVIMITAFSDVDTLLQATELKLTKYLIKPFYAHDLFESIKIATTELAQIQVIPTTKLALRDGYLWDFEEHLLLKDNKEIKLTPKEKKILQSLFSNPNRTLTYDTLLSDVWENFEGYNIDTLKTMVKNIRKKLPENTIQNIYGIGYKYEN